MCCSRSPAAATAARYRAARNTHSPSASSPAARPLRMRRRSAQARRGRRRRRRWAAGWPACFGLSTWRTGPAARSARRSPRPRRGTPPLGWTSWPVGAGLSIPRGDAGGADGGGAGAASVGPARGRARGGGKRVRGPRGRGVPRRPAGPVTLRAGRLGTRCMLGAVVGGGCC